MSEMAPPLVTICVATYNQEKYLPQCLEGIIHQECSFPFEIIVHEDASTDQTAAVVARYASQYPQIIRPRYETENQYCKHVGIAKELMFPLARGKYICLCEGDDYWTDKYKLSRQVAYLEAHDDCSLLGENGTILYEDSGKTVPFSGAPERDYTLDELAYLRRFPTASIMFRQRDLEAINQLKVGSFDTAMWCALAKRGRVHFLPVNSSIYRRGNGVTSSDAVRWAAMSLRLDKIIKANFHLSFKARYQRAFIIGRALLKGASAAWGQNQKKVGLKYLLAACWRMPAAFFVFLEEPRFYSQKLWARVTGRHEV